MTSSNVKPEREVLTDELESFDFDDWKDLFETDPDLFERYRKKILESQIAMAPESTRPRLQGLMFQMEAEAVRSPTPISYSLRLSAMMMDKFDELRQKLALLSGARADYEAAEQQQTESADIIPFNRRESD
ncbi:MAG: DUF3135 domain-containing protein [Gammaproteobacteria bacterium]|nr:DUF3135 domain-containing protein [Gammaproteobacteria bacterium]